MTQAMGNPKTTKSSRRGSASKSKSSFWSWLGLAASSKKSSGLGSKRPVGGKLALVVVALSVVGGYAWISQSFAASGTPELASGFAGMCLDDFRNNAANGAIVDLWQCNGTAAQQWTMTSKTNGQIKLHGKCLDIYQQKLNGAKLELFTCKTSDNSNQLWTYNGGHQLVSSELRPAGNAIRQMCIQPSGAANGSTVTLEPCSPTPAPLQKWEFQNYVNTTSSGGGGGGGASGGTGSSNSSTAYQVASGYAGQCMDDLRNNAANAAIVDIYQCNGTAAQKWTRVGTQGKQQVMHNGKCLDVYQNGTGDGQVVDLFTCKAAGSNNNQLWNVTNGTLVGVQSGKCLNAPDPRNGTQLQIWKCDGRNSERWVFQQPNTATSNTTTSTTTSSGTSTGSGSSSGSTSSTAAATPEIASAIAGHCLDDLKNSQANLAVIDNYTCNGTAAQQFTFSANQIMIHGKCVDVFRQGKTAGTKVELYTCNGGGNQKWTYTNNTFVGQQSKLCLNGPGPQATSGDPYNGLQLQIQKCDGRISEKWFFKTFTPTPPAASNTGSTSGSGSSSGSSSSGGFPGVTNTAGPCDPTTDPFCPPTD